MASPVRLGSGSGILIRNRSLDVVLDIPRPLSSAVEARYDLPGVSGGKLAFIVLGGTRGVKENVGASRSAEPRKKLRGVVDAEKLVTLGGCAPSLADGPCGRSSIFRCASKVGEARRTGLSGESGDGAVKTLRGREGVLFSITGAREYSVVTAAVDTVDGELRAEERPPPTKLVMPLNHDRCRF